MDWSKIKKNNLEWRKMLWNETTNTLQLMAKNKVDMTELNSIGVFHKIRIAENEMKKEYLSKKNVPHNWIIKGNFPGIWCALFDAKNTYSYDYDPPIIKLNFKPNFQIFDLRFEEHILMWNKWKENPDNLSKPNLWHNDVNYNNISFKDRIPMLDVKHPYHLEFFKEYNFGAVIGYNDYISLVIIQEDVIENVEFLY